MGQAGFNNQHWFTASLLYRPKIMIIIIIVLIIMILLQLVSFPGVCDKQLFHLANERDKFEIWQEQL